MSHARTLPCIVAKAAVGWTSRGLKGKEEAPLDRYVGVTLWSRNVSNHYTIEPVYGSMFSSITTPHPMQARGEFRVDMCAEDIRRAQQYERFRHPTSTTRETWLIVKELC